MTVRFERTTRLDVSPVDAFDLSLDVDFHLRSMADSEESIEGGIDTGAMRLGDDVTWRARHFGIWWTMTSVITEFERPHRFVDEQRTGPFRRFHHEHRFATVDGGTSMHDLIEFAAPLGPLGRLAERLVLEKYIPTLIDRRNDELVRALRRD